MDNSNDIYISENKLQEIKDLQMLLQKEKSEYMKNNIFLDIILESLKDLNKPLREKVKDILLRGELTDISNLLQIFVKTVELTYEESNELKIAVERRTIEKANLILKDLNKISDCNARNLEELLENIKFDINEERDNLLAIQKQITEEQNLYIENLIELGEKLQELIDLKITGTEIAEQLTVKNAIECEKHNLQSKIVKQQTRLKIFTDIPMSMDAYRKALKNLKEQEEAYMKEIERIRKLVDNYKVVIKNEEYKEILKDYKLYKKSIQNKLWALGKIKNKE